MLNNPTTANNGVTSSVTSTVTNNANAVTSAVTGVTPSVTTYQLTHIQNDFDVLATQLLDITTLLGVIAYNSDLKPFQIQAMAKIAMDSVYGACDIAEYQAKAIDELLKGGDV